MLLKDRKIELSLDMFCVYVCADLSKIILMYIVLGAIELVLIPFLLFYKKNYTYNSIRKHSSAIFLRQRKLGEMFNLSSLNDLCVIWGTMFNNASHYMILFRGYFELIQAMNTEVELNYS